MNREEVLKVVEKLEWYAMNERRAGLPSIHDELAARLRAAVEGCGQYVEGECVEAGLDIDGTCRLVVNCDRQELRDGPKILYRMVRVMLAPPPPQSKEPQS